MMLMSVNNQKQNNKSNILKSNLYKTGKVLRRIRYAAKSMRRGFKAASRGMICGKKSMEGFDLRNCIPMSTDSEERECHPMMHDKSTSVGHEDSFVSTADASEQSDISEPVEVSEWNKSMYFPPPRLTCLVVSMASEIISMGAVALKGAIDDIRVTFANWSTGEIDTRPFFSFSSTGNESEPTLHASNPLKCTPTKLFTKTIPESAWSTDSDTPRDCSVDVSDPSSTPNVTHGEIDASIGTVQSADEEIESVHGWAELWRGAVVRLEKAIDDSSLEEVDTRPIFPSWDTFESMFAHMFPHTSEKLVSESTSSRQYIRSPAVISDHDFIEEDLSVHDGNDNMEKANTVNEKVFRNYDLVVVQLKVRQSRTFQRIRGSKQLIVRKTGHSDKTKWYNDSTYCSKNDTLPTMYEYKRLLASDMDISAYIPCRYFGQQPLEQIYRSHQVTHSLVDNKTIESYQFAVNGIKDYFKAKQGISNDIAECV